MPEYTFKLIFEGCGLAGTDCFCLKPLPTRHLHIFRQGTVNRVAGVCSENCAIKYLNDHGITS